MRLKPVISLLLLFAFNAHGQTPVGSWADHLSYRTARNIAVGTKDVYISTGSSVIVYNKEYDELKKMSRVNGLTETGISDISWSGTSQALVIGYTNTNVDILSDNTIYNIPDIYKKYIPGNKVINRIRCRGKYAYLACSFGIVVIDITKKEVSDTWKPGTGTASTAVLDIAFSTENIYAATENGVFSAARSNPGLSYFGNWNLLNMFPDPYGIYSSVIVAGDNLYVNKSDPSAGGDSLFIMNTSSSLFSYLPGVYNSSLDPAPEGFTISSGTLVRYYKTDGSLKNSISSFGAPNPAVSQAIADNNDIWIADKNSGLIKGENMSSFSVLNLPGPVSNSAFNVTSLNGKTIISGGGTDDGWNPLARSMQVSVYHENSWTFPETAAASDVIRTVIDPDDQDHFYISSWGGGLLEYRNNSLINHFTEANSPLQTMIPGKPFVRICGLAIDKENKLWITQSGVPGSLKVLRQDGTWIVNPLTIDAPVIGDLIIASSGYKWIVLPEGHGLAVFDDNKTADSFNDDRFLHLIVKDTENEVISEVNSLAEDLEGNIWIGTNEGPLVYYNPEKVFDQDLKASRIKIPRNDGSGLADYMLKSENITSVGIDGANKKWLGTSSSGAYYLSSDGITLIKNFNEQNSPILSDSIISLAVDNKTGDVWFGTSKGLQSFRGNATAGAEKFGKVYAFPNPVREDFSGNVTITGLMSETRISITDVSGNLVYKTISDGGEATWDLKTYNGRYVTTGVYLIFCASSDGAQSCVTKILVIR